MVNYFVKDYLVDKNKSGQVYTNTTMMNKETRDYFTNINANECVREPSSNIPRFGIAGKKASASLPKK